MAKNKFSKLAKAKIRRKFEKTEIGDSPSKTSNKSIEILKSGTTFTIWRSIFITLLGKF